ncbi:MAG TPA: hypothetical protein VEV13_06820, partial [Candidatus Limnocylindria bacterium]|nr:hypothetical protein [Candidatus Limnocylindria bacterium]
TRWAAARGYALVNELARRRPAGCLSVPAVLRVLETTSPRCACTTTTSNTTPRLAADQPR